MRAPRPLVPPALALAATLALLAGGASAATAAEAPPAAQPPAPPAVVRATQAPEAILADVVRDLRKVRSMRFSGTTTDASGTAHLSAAFTASGRARQSTRQGRVSLRMIFLPSVIYFNGNAAFWKGGGGKDGASTAKRLAGRWVRSPKAAAKALRGGAPGLTPKTIAACIGVNPGTLTVEPGTVGGQPAVVVVDHGDKPGTDPERIYVAASGPALPLRMTQTGPRQPGGKLDERCEDEEDATTASDIRLGGFDQPLKIVAPRHAIELPADKDATT